MIHEMDIKVETGGKNNHLLLEQNKTAARAWLEDPQIQVQIILYNIIHISNSRFCLLLVQMTVQNGCLVQQNGCLLLYDNQFDSRKQNMKSKSE